MLTTFGDFKQSVAVNVANVTPSSAQFRDLLNEATRRLMKRGDWEGTIVPIHVCVSRGCIAWPRYVGNVRKLNLCCSPVPISNNWYDFLPWEKKRFDMNAWWGWIGGRWATSLNVVQRQRTSVFQDIQGDNRKIRLYASTPLDFNKTVKLFGIDTNGQQLMTKGVGAWTPGETLVLKAGYAESISYVRHLDYVLKDETQGPISMFAWNTASSVLEPLANYDASETRPSYAKIQLNTPCLSSCSTTMTAVALVKLQFVPVKLDSDLVLIDDVDALKKMFLSIRAEEATKFQEAKAFEADAVYELNRTLEDNNPIDQVPVDLGELGGTYVGVQKCW